jgi:prepilin-type N-terminal cleavage/methylation domain-containing protein
MLRRAFTLIELLIVVAIIAILAAIAVPNFLEAQTRAKVSRVNADLRTLATGIEAYRVDHNRYPEGTDNPNNYDPAIVAFLGPLAPGYYTFRTRTAGGAPFAGAGGFATLTTPVAYVTQVLLDPFARQVGGNLTYAYRDAKATGNFYILTSFGPDADVLNPGGVGSESMSPFSTRMDTNTPARMGDINERAVIHYVENTNAAIVSAVNAWGGLRPALADLAYDPTNGTLSEGDIFRIGP